MSQLRKQRREDFALAAARAPVFAALGDKTRLSLVSQLSDGRSRSLTQLTESTDLGGAHGAGLSRQAVTKHLRVLEDAGLVQCVRIGRESLYEYVPGPVSEISHYLDFVSRQWDQSLERLKQFVEEDN